MEFCGLSTRFITLTGRVFPSKVAASFNRKSEKRLLNRLG
ncbi:hypothetical protein LSH36_489g01054 [Paralvinella palmiformis]|uniref:Uncharacterized protein n=1 Tax=Paralvinella palmiformis TaxID=53620 RepID=A0AAD9MWQ5_9ANNE|nr:hypothetical protein LSH36_489g01054 [Paralvinella palmiformis]